MQRSCECSRMSANHGPPIVVRTIQAVFIPPYRAILRVRNRSPEPESEYSPSGEGSTPCHTVNDRLPSCKESFTSQLNPLSLKCIRLQVDHILSFKILISVNNLSRTNFVLRQLHTVLRGHAYRLLQGPSQFRRRSSMFSVCVMNHWNRLLTHLLSFYL